MAAAAACGGSVLVKNVIPRHLECITAKLREMSVEVTEFDDAVLVRREGKLTKTNIKTLPYPGFPTDMQPQMTTALCLAEVWSVIRAKEGMGGLILKGTEAKILSDVVAQFYAYLSGCMFNDPVGMAIYAELHYMMSSLMLGEWFE